MGRTLSTTVPLHECVQFTSNFILCLHYQVSLLTKSSDNRRRSGQLAHSIKYTVSCSNSAEKKNTIKKYELNPQIAILCWDPLRRACNFVRSVCSSRWCLYICCGHGTISLIISEVSCCLNIFFYFNPKLHSNSTPL